VIVNGLIQQPSPPALALGNPSDWDRAWPYFTVEDYAARVDFPVLPLLLLQDPADTSGFVREWRIKEPTPWMHIGYAIQWFAFALIALVIYLRLSMQGPREAQS
jgi:surfeit locus 1 family protein